MTKYIIYLSHIKTHYIKCQSRYQFPIQHKFKKLGINEYDQLIILDE